MIIGLLLWLDLPLEQYERGSSPITMLLEPAVVALALPLYQQARQIQAKLKPILICTLASVLISVCTTLLIGHFMDIDPALLASLATKSITTPLAMSVSQSIGGIPAIAAAVVVVVGIVGALIGYPLLKLLKVTDPEAQGLAMGACAHAHRHRHLRREGDHPGGLCIARHGGVRDPHRGRRSAAVCYLSLADLITPLTTC